MWIIIVLAIIVFLVMEHTIAFWLIFVPLALLFLISIVSFLKNRRAGLSDLLLIVGIFIVIIIALVVVGSPKCQHDGERQYVYSFTPQDIAEYHDIKGYRKEYCKECDYYFGNTYFYGTPADSSYLEVIRENTNSDELVDGEYYTITATVTFAYYYGSDISISCKVENEDIVIGFTAEFREEYEDAVSYEVLETGDKITFRGKFSRADCGWTDCELIR